MSDEDNNRLTEHLNDEHDERLEDCPTCNRMRVGSICTSRCPTLPDEVRCYEVEGHKGPHRGISSFIWEKAQYDPAQESDPFGYLREKP